MAIADTASAAASGTAWFLIYYAGITAALYTIGLVVGPLSSIARLLASFMAVIICALYGVCASIILTLLGKQQIAQWATARAFKWVMLLTTGIRFDIIDPERHVDRNRPAIFIANHQTALDVLLLGAMFPKYCSVTSKQSLKYYPFLGWFMVLSGSVFIDRRNSKDARQAMAGAAEVIRSKRQSVFMFPEGTRSNSQEPMLLPFKKGAFHLAVQAQAPIVPLVVANYSYVASAKSHFRSGTIPVKVLEPIPTKGLTADDVNELAQRVRDAMLKELINISAQARGQEAPIPADFGIHDSSSSINGAAVAVSSTNGTPERKTRSRKT